MKNRIFITILLAVFVSLFSACGGGDDGGSASVNDDTNAIQDRTLNSGDSVTCKSETTFTVTPSTIIAPDVTFTKDVESGDMTVAVDVNSSGFVIVSNCTQ